MRPIFITAAMLVLALTACNQGSDLNVDRWQDSVPGLEEIMDPETGERYTSYMGHPMPLQEDSHQRMMEVLNLVSTQQGEIDDELFVSMFTSSPLSTINLFKADVVGETKLEWYGRYEIPGISLGGTIQANDDGTITSIHGASHDDVEVMHHMNMLGIEGFYATYFWEYNAESNILISSYTSTGKEFVAELLFFDGVQAVMLGKIAGISYAGNAVDGSGNEVVTEYELHYLSFQEGGKISLDGYVTGDMYELLRETCDIEAQMESIMYNHSNYDVDALAEELKNSKWRECGVLHYFDETMSHLELAAAWDGEWYADGAVFTDYTFNADGVGNLYYEPAIDPFEPITEDYSWSLDTATRTLTLDYDANGTNRVAEVVAYWASNSEAWMVWDIENSNQRIVLRSVE